MPYFKNKKHNILYIHVPKTGGTTIEKYFSKLTNVTLNNTSLFGASRQIHRYGFRGSLQHQTLRNILRNRRLFQIKMINIKIIISVRNPYTRMISELFYKKKINKRTHPDKVFKILSGYLTSGKLHDNHILQQYKFLLLDGKIYNNIHIIKNETLNDDMVKIGYPSFKKTTKYNVSNSVKINYFNYLNNNSINLINTIYDKDFKIFGYKKISSSNNNLPAKKIS